MVEVMLWRKDWGGGGGGDYGGAGVRRSVMVCDVLDRGWCWLIVCESVGGQGRVCG